MPAEGPEPLIIGAEQLRVFINEQIKPATVSMSQIYRLLGNGLPHGKLGKKIICQPAAIRAYLVRLATANGKDAP
jgi:hypothetical protein